MYSRNTSFVVRTSIPGNITIHVQKSGSHMMQLTGSVFVMVYDLSRVVFCVSI